MKRVPIVLLIAPLAFQGQMGVRLAEFVKKRNRRAPCAIEGDRHATFIEGLTIDLDAHARPVYRLKEGPQIIGLAGDGDRVVGSVRHCILLCCWVFQDATPQPGHDRKMVEKPAKERKKVTGS
jgi:hypothetical protein